MDYKRYVLPEPFVDSKEDKALIALTETYSKMISPNAVNMVVEKIGEKVPATIKNYAAVTKEMITETDLFVKCLDVLGKGFQTLEQVAAKVTLSEKDIINRVNPIVEGNEITSLDEICLARSYDLVRLVDKAKFVDIIAALVEGAATGAPGFPGIPFNLVLSTFLFYRSVQSVALFYGYDIKNNPAELQIASEVFMNAMNPKNISESELSSVITKIMLFSTTTTVQQTIKKGWTSMAERGGITLLLTQMRALANSAAKKALEKAGKQGLERTAFTEVFEQIGKRLTQNAIKKALPYVGAVIGATIDTAQMVQIIKFANVFYCKRFILEKEMRINMLIEAN